MSTARQGAEMSDFKHKEEEQLSRQQVAERLIDIAYALSAGGPLELGPAGRRITVPVANEMRLERALKSKGGQLELGLELSWSTQDG
jgi:amphi-Trp domain-containing protein